jgi:sugar phosphate permease
VSADPAIVPAATAAGQPPLPVATVAVDEDHELRSHVGKRAAVFVLTWIAYASYYFGRKGFPVVKSTLQERLGLSVGMLGWIDTGYLAAYAVGQFLSGIVGDRIGSRRLIGYGMLGVAAACAAFGLASAAWLFLLLFVLNGTFQSSGWPGTVKAMGSWFTQKERGTVMGVWSTCYQAGGLIATAVATFLFVRYGWRWAFLGPAMLIAIVGIVNLFFLPERTGTTRTKEMRAADAAADAHAAGASAAAAPTENSGNVLHSPVLWSLSASYFCLKLIRYSLLFWLPYYLNKELGYSKAQAGYQSISFEVGGIVGSIAIGYVSDRYFPGRRRIVASVMIAALAAALLLYIRLAPVSVMLNFCGMALVGFCLFAPDTLIAGAAAQDIGGKHDVAKAAGFINGFGSVGAVFQGPVTSGMSISRFGWNGLFYLFAALALVSSIALLIGKRRAHEGTS